MKNILKQIALFSKLKESELKNLEKISLLKEYKNEEVFFHKGDIIEDILILVDGIVTIYKEDTKGNEVVIGYFHRYAMLAEPPTLLHEGAFSSGKFKSDGKLLHINLEAFENDFMFLPHISKGIIESLLKKIKLLQQNINLNINATAKEKILFFYKHNYLLSIDLKKYEIASLLGISAETHSRIAKALVKERKLLSVDSRYKCVD